MHPDTARRRRVTTVLVACALSWMHAPVRATTHDRAALRGAVERVIDGDTLVVEGRTVRLWGIDAPELSQTCGGDAVEPVWDCGRRSRLLLQALVGSAPVVCETRARHRGRVVAVCAVGGRDIAAAMVSAGMALDDAAYSNGRYSREQAAARRERRGLWRGPFETPRNHRNAP
jgi:endonuclease YncB( thermonuclease family)